MTGRRGRYVVAITLALAAMARAQSPAPDAPLAGGVNAAAPAGAIAAQPVSAGAAPINETNSAPAAPSAEAAATPSPSLTGQAAPASPAPPGGQPAATSQPTDFDRSGIEGQPLGHGGTGAAGRTGGISARPSDSSSWWRTLGALVLVVTLILGMRWFLRRTSRGRSPSGGGQVIEILSRTSISARQSLLLIRVGQRMLVVGAGETMTTLAEIDDPTQVAELLGSVEQARSNSLSNTFARALGQWRSSSVDFAGQLDEAGASGQPGQDSPPGTSDPRTPAGGAADRLRSMAQKVRDVGATLRGRP